MMQAGLVSHTKVRLHFATRAPGSGTGWTRHYGSWLHVGLTGAPSRSAVVLPLGRCGANVGGRWASGGGRVLTGVAATMILAAYFAIGGFLFVWVMRDDRCRLEFRALAIGEKAGYIGAAVVLWPLVVLGGLC